MTDWPALRFVTDQLVANEEDRLLPSGRHSRTNQIQAKSKIQWG